MDHDCNKEYQGPFCLILALQVCTLCVRALHDPCNSVLVFVRLLVSMPFQVIWGYSFRQYYRGRRVLGGGGGRRVLPLGDRGMEVDAFSHSLVIQFVSASYGDFNRLPATGPSSAIARVEAFTDGGGDQRP